MKSPSAICGATGNIGHKIAEKLLAAGEPAHAIARERVRLGPLREKGAEPWPGNLTMSEATRILGEAIGNPGLTYVRFPENGAREAMAATGMSWCVIEAMMEMQRGFTAGTIRPTQARSVGNSTLKSVEEFARTLFARAYRAAA
jgi:NAD(P)-dependent dehydrogenase (short-subunit alcohol dehydrogenase family)